MHFHASRRSALLLQVPAERADAVYGAIEAAEDTVIFFSGVPGSEVFKMLVWLGQRARFCHGQDEIIEILDDEDPEAAKSSEGRIDRVWR